MTKLQSEKDTAERDKDALSAALVHARSQLGALEDFTNESAVSAQQERISTSLSLSASASAATAAASLHRELERRLEAEEEQSRE